MKYSIEGETLTGIANAIRSKHGYDDKIEVNQMARRINGIESEVYTKHASFHAEEYECYEISNAILKGAENFVIYKTSNDGWHMDSGGDAIITIILCIEGNMYTYAVFSCHETYYVDWDGDGFADEVNGNYDSAYTELHGVKNVSFDSTTGTIVTERNLDKFSGDYSIVVFSSRIG